MFAFEIYSLTTKRKDGKKVVENWDNSRVSISILRFVFIDYSNQRKIENIS
ncbi:hypothetical protein [Fusobacterium sp.]|uniref:hypothetical protein n=1 Tax=Fusobacterium sp. TaxID=68766 RepID=UPI002902DF20|nr:hypothetical protein [Fusobacterium sp.]MDU1910043.1 hypothetical protein [Fusobacterium sp.]